MNPVRSFGKTMLLCTVVLFAFTFTSWKGTAPGFIKATQDTVPPKSEKKIAGPDQALQELDGAQADLEKSVHDIDWNKMNADLKDAMKNLDVKLKSMDDDLKKSLRNVDVEKMKQDVDASIAKIDWAEIKRSIDKAKNIDLDNVKASVEKAKQELEKQKPEIEKSLQNAHREIDRAKLRLNDYNSFINSLDKDGLINKKEGYKIEHRDGTLRINGNEQSTEVYHKYRTFLEKNRTFTLEKTSDGFNLKND